MSIAIALLCVALCAYLYWLRKGIRRTASLPPSAPGLFLLGHTLQLGHQGADFIHACRKKHGDIYTLSLAGKRMTLVCNPEAASSLLRAPVEAVAFRPAVEQFTQRIFGLPSDAFFPKHLLLLSTLRGLLSATAIQPHLLVLLRQLQQHSPVHLAATDAPTKVDLVSSISRLIFRAAVTALFGGRFLHRHGFEELQKAYQAFESLFELAASPLPHVFIPRFRAARRQLLSAFRGSLAAGDFQGAVAGQLLAECAWLPAQLHANLLLALLWASLANSVPASIWAVLHLLQPPHAERLQAIRAQCSQQTEKQQGTESSAEAPREQRTSEGAAAASAWEAGILQAAMQKGGTVAKAVAEAVRLYSPGFDVRMAVQRLQLPSSCGAVTIQPGTLLAISPYELHTSESLYGETAGQFDPDRSLSAAEAGGSWPWGHAGVAFGGGHFRCPGRAFAEAEMGVVLGFLLMQYDMRQTDGGGAACLPEAELRRQIGIRWPKAPCWVTLHRREASGWV